MTEGIQRRIALVVVDGVVGWVVVGVGGDDKVWFGGDGRDLVDDGQGEVLEGLEITVEHGGFRFIAHGDDQVVAAEVLPSQDGPVVDVRGSSDDPALPLMVHQGDRVGVTLLIFGRGLRQRRPDPAGGSVPVVVNSVFNLDHLLNIRGHQGALPAVRIVFVATVV